MAVITIARQFGAGGRTIGVMLAKRLHYNLLDEAIIHELAKKARVTMGSVKAVERSAGGFVSRLLASAVSPGYIDRLTGQEIGYMDENVYLNILKEVMTEFAQKDNTILLGRGGQFILKDFKNVFHFLLVADDPDRLSFMQKFYKMSDKKAQKAVSDGDKRRANIYAKLHETRYDSANLYHMVFNMSRMTLEQAAEQICALINANA